MEPWVDWRISVVDEDAQQKTLVAFAANAVVDSPDAAGDRREPSFTGLHQIEGVGMAKEASGPHDASWSRAGLAAGIVFVVVALIAFVISLGPDDTSGHGIAKYFAEHDNAVEWQAFLFGVSAMFFIWFAATIAVAVRRSEMANDLRLGEIALAGAVASVVVYFVGISCWATLAHLFGGYGGDRFSEPALGDSLVLFNLANLAFAMASFTTAIFVAAAAKALTGIRLLADWCAWAGGAVALILLINAFVQLVYDPDSDFLGTGSFLLFLAWVLAASGLLTAASRRERVSPSPVETTDPRV